MGEDRTVQDIVAECLWEIVEGTGQSWKEAGDGQDHARRAAFHFMNAADKHGLTISKAEDR